MEPEDKKLLEKLYKITEENNEMLHTMRSIQRRQFIFLIVKWIIILGISIGLFYSLEPYVDNFKTFITESEGAFEKFKGLIPG